MRKRVSKKVLVKLMNGIQMENRLGKYAWNIVLENRLGK